VTQDQEFEAYVARAWPSLVRSAVLLGCELHEAEDLVQTMLIRCYRSWRAVRAAAAPDAYVYRMLVNCHHDSHRRRWWGEQPTAAPPDRPGQDRTAEVDDADVVSRALQYLDRGQREVVVLRWFAQLSEQETAEALAIPVGTVKSRASRALARLATDPTLNDLIGGDDRGR
jgi:RNA polymerase sigma-70 factor (sigma-E family)